MANNVRSFPPWGRQVVERTRVAVAGPGAQRIFSKWLERDQCVYGSRLFESKRVILAPVLEYPGTAPMANNKRVFPSKASGGAHTSQWPDPRATHFLKVVGVRSHPQLARVYGSRLFAHSPRSSLYAGYSAPALEYGETGRQA